MCYYTSQRHMRDEVARFVKQLDLPFTNSLPDIGPRYRIGPSQKQVVFRLGEDGTGQLELAEFNMVPPGAKERPKRLLANARSDGLTSKWPWKFVHRTKRAVAIIDGFFEPEKVAMSKDKAPWSYYQVNDGALFFVAGFAPEFIVPDTGEIVPTCAFITVDANPVMRVHNRMPAILDTVDARAWVGGNEAPLELLKPYAPETMSAWRVHDKAKNRNTPDGPGLIESVSDDIQGSLF
ncbi:MAG: SOS response-associated peptidase family protein [Pseudomonadota bacterium]